MKSEKKSESARERRVKYERELYQYSLVDSPGQWKNKRASKQGRSKSLDKLSKTILALLPPPESVDDSMALTIPGMDAELMKTPLTKMQEKEDVAASLRAVSTQAPLSCASETQLSLMMAISDIHIHVGAAGGKAAGGGCSAAGPDRPCEAALPV